jgi:hypothetical protein
MAGDKANAKKSYEAFFTTWKDADSDLPDLVAANKEYAALWPLRAPRERAVEKSAAPLHLPRC